MPTTSIASDVKRSTIELLVSIRHAAVGRGHRRSLAEYTGIDLPVTERWVLHALTDLSFVPLSQVAAELDTAMPVLSRACARLEAAGHIIRLQDPRDRRRTLIGLCDATFQALTEWNLRWPGPYVAAVDGWKDEEVACLDEWLRAVAAARFHQVVPPAVGVPSQIGLRADAVREQLSATIRVLVPAAGRHDILALPALPDVAGVTSPTFHVLLTISALGGASAGTVSELDDIDEALVRRRIATLQEHGLVENQVDRVRSRSHVAPTARGLRVIDEVLNGHLASLPSPPRRLLDGALASLLTRFVDMMTHDQQSAGVRIRDLLR